MRKLEQEVFATARAFAITAHADQRYGDMPYIYHLEQVHAMACEHNLSVDVKIAAFLHDVIEDTQYTRHDIETNFGLRVSHLVFAVSNDRNKQCTYAKIRIMGVDAIGLKLCDRVCNLTACKVGKHDRLLRKYCGDKAFGLMLYNPAHRELFDLWQTYNILCTLHRPSLR